MSDSEEKPVEVVSRYVAKDLLEGLEWDIISILKVGNEYIIMVSCENLSYDIQFRVNLETVHKTMYKYQLEEFSNGELVKSYDIRAVNKYELMENIK